MAWQFKHVETEFPVIPEGRYRVVIVGADKAVSKSSGNDMLVIKMQVSGYKSSNVFAYISFLDDKPEFTNRILTQMFECFQIEEGNFDLGSYLGKAGGIAIKNEEFDGKKTAKFHYFLRRREVDKLPPFEGEVPTFNFEQLPDIPDDDDPWA